jgi:CRISPR-associated protein Cas1
VPASKSPTSCSPSDTGCPGKAAATTATATIPQLRFVHEDSSKAFILDVTDLVRTSVIVPLAFATARRCLDDPTLVLERELPRQASEAFRKETLVDKLIERIKTLFEADR